jgi:hypothetical protein
MVAVLCILPLLGGIFIVVKAFSNHRIKTKNDDFVPVAWHNLRSDQIFPDHLGYTSADEGTPAWIRQGIAAEAKCADVLRDDFGKAAVAKGCRTVLRATYVDIGGDMAATLAVLVFGSNADAEEIGNKEFNWAQGPGALVAPAAFPGTPAAAWTGKRAIVGGAQKVGLTIYDEPYVVAVSAGPADGSRPVGKLPEPWKLDGRGERSAYTNSASSLVTTFALTLDSEMTRKPR